MSEAQAVQIPWLAPGIIGLGPANGSAVTRLAYAAKELLESGEPIPDSPFAKWAADRICGEDKQDLIVFLAGRRGSGKSYSSLWIAERVSREVAKIKGGKPSDYFSLTNCCTLEDTEGVSRILDNAGQHQVVIIDDASLAVNNRNWASPGNKNFVALLTVCRDRRWFLMFTAPLKKMADNQVRDMVDFNLTIYKPMHADIAGRGGFNILKAVSQDISTSGKEYNHKLHFSGVKVDFWLTFRPSLDLVKRYDILRAEGSKKVGNRIATTGSYQSKKPTDNRSLAEKNLETMIETYGERIRSLVSGSPDISMNKLAAKCGISHQQAARICERLNIPIKVRKN